MTCINVNYFPLNCKSMVHFTLYLLLNLLLEVIFSVQNSKLMFSVEFSPDLVQIQVRETVSGVFLAQTDIPTQVWHMVEIIRRDFNEQHMTQVLITENQLGTMQMMEEVSEHVGMNTPRFLTLYMWHNQSTISSFLGRKKDLCRSQLLSKRMRGSLSRDLQSANRQDNHRRWRQDQFCAPLRTCKILRTQLLDSSLICKYFGYCLGFCNFYFASSSFMLKR